MDIQKYVSQSTDEILSLPISVITEIMGTEGLRARFAREFLAAFDDPELIDMNARAHDLGANLHADDRRSHEPVENHLLRGAIRVISSNHLGEKDAFLAAMMFLHDAPEDHPWKLAGVTNSVSEEEARIMAFGRIAIEFAPEVSEGVEWMTNPLPQKGKTSTELYIMHNTELVIHGPPRPIKGKIGGDVPDNVTGIFWSKHAPPEQYLKWARKYSQTIPIFRRGLSRPDLGLSKNGLAYAHRQLDMAEIHCSNVIAAMGIKASFSSAE